MSKIKFGRQWLNGHHRSGWPYAMESLRCLDDEDGVILEGFIEKKFAWGRDPGDRYNDFAPYREPWIGFIHNPPNIPEWFNLNQHSPEDIFNSERWLQSVAYCQGIFTLSSYLKEWLQSCTSIPVCNLLHPTEIPTNKFSIEKYQQNSDKKLVQVGWWLRKYHTFFQLQLSRTRKVLLDIGYPWMKTIMERELDLLSDPTVWESVELMQYVSNEQYDQLLGENIVFLHLYDSSANNTIIECIVRETPVLVNPLPAVIEYLGADYPFYFSTPDEASQKAENDELIASTHQYLSQLDIKEKLTGEFFRTSLVESNIFKSLKERTPKVSLITCLFAADKDIADFMEDVTRQTVFDQAELLLFDLPFSHEDPTMVENVVRSYAEKYGNIVYRKLTEDPGLFQVWIEQIKISRGRYIAMTCLDDRRAPNYLEEHLRELEMNPEIDLVCGPVLATRVPYETWDRNTAYRTFCKGFNWQKESRSSLGSKHEFGLADLFYKDASGKWVDSDCLPHCMALWRKSIHDKYGYFDEKTYGPIADWAFWLQCAERGMRFKLLDKVLGLYFENPVSYNRRVPTEEIKQKLIATYWERFNEQQMHAVLSREERQHESNATLELSC